jgi:hypothetical protein
MPASEATGKRRIEPFARACALIAVLAAVLLGAQPASAAFPTVLKVTWPAGRKRRKGK